ncbi:interferon-induced protein 44-like isoform X2 [Choloepus didactylus]|uniref:interferon-induced protein 44-like isoform X2 n=1 Tax=Choloepus didactylus TaxID=27675 RepID=UPI0018A00DA9|nr:interferon-induced protein 44-like isoform X2 [Choloepus didactylus]
MFMGIPFKICFRDAVIRDPRRYGTTAMETFFFNRRPKIAAEELQFFFCDEQALSLNPKSKQFFISSSVFKTFGSGTWYDYLECEVFRVEGIKDDPDSIRKIHGASQHRENLLTDLKTYKPITDLVPKIRILLLGPVGSGKSSFFNSVKSVFRGHMTRQAIAGSEITGITEQYRIYSIEDENGRSLPFMFCDSMGLGEKEGAGVCMDDILHILKGSVPDRYQFNPHKPITPNHPAFITSPSLKDRIHCVVYVLDVNSINTISSTMMSKLKRIKGEALNYGIAHVALLTKVNNCYEVLQDNFQNMNRSMTYQSQIMSVSKMLGIPIPNIMAVENYASERELDHLKDVLILSAVRQMLRAADDFLEDLPPEKTDDIARMSQHCI